jgi:hypothetical protein
MFVQGNAPGNAQAITPLNRPIQPIRKFVIIMIKHSIIIFTSLLLSHSAMAGSHSVTGVSLSSREVIELTPEHRDTVLSEMHQFISGLQQITAALSSEDMETVSRVSRSLGTTMAGGIPQELKKALPKDFRVLGGSVHKQFDQVALDADALADPQHTLSQLADVLSSCAACHSRYQIKAR